MNDEMLGLNKNESIFMSCLNSLVAKTAEGVSVESDIEMMKFVIHDVRPNVVNKALFAVYAQLSGMENKNG